MSDGADEHRDMVETLEIKSIMDEKSKIAIALRHAKADGLKEGAIYGCMYCNGNARGWEQHVTGPNSSGNYVHRQVGSKDREVCCLSSLLWVSIYRILAESTPDLNEQLKQLNRRQKPKDTY